MGKHPKTNLDIKCKPYRFEDPNATYQRVRRQFVSKEINSLVVMSVLNQLNSGYATMKEELVEPTRCRFQWNWHEKGLGLFYFMWEQVPDGGILAYENKLKEINQLKSFQSMDMYDFINWSDSNNVDEQCSNSNVVNNNGQYVMLPDIQKQQYGLDEHGNAVPVYFGTG